MSYGMKKKVNRLGRQLGYIRRLNRLQVGDRGSGQSIAMYGANYAAANPAQRLARRALGFRGQGDYFTDLARKYVPTGTFSSLGRTLGGMTGVPGMNAVGAYAGNKVAKWAGFGDYNANQLMQGGDQPVTVNASDDLTGDIFMSHREFVGNVSATTNASGVSPFSVVSYAINPGLSQTFPWLSQIAQNFTMYEFQGLIFEYKPTSGEGAGSTNALGKVVMATNYDPNAVNFVTSSQMESYDYAQCVKPSVNALHGVETANVQQFGNMQYVRTGASSRDLIFTDIGKFQIATEGVTGASSSTINVGELWVTYRIKLSRANLFGTQLCYNQQFDYFVARSDGNSTTGSTAGYVALLPDAGRYNLTGVSSTSGLAAPLVVNNIGGKLSGTTNNSVQYIFPNNIVDGIYEVVTNLGSVSASTQVSAFTSLTNCVIAFGGGTGRSILSQQPTQASVGALNVISVSYVRVIAPGSLVASFVIPFSTTLPNNGVVMVKVTCVNQLLA